MHFVFINTDHHIYDQGVGKWKRRRINASGDVGGRDSAHVGCENVRIGGA